jgi:hypothetical protein
MLVERTFWSNLSLKEKKNNRNYKIRVENLLTKGLKFTNKAMKK